MTAPHSSPGPTGLPLAPTVFALGTVGLLVVLVPDAPLWRRGTAAGLLALVLVASLLRTEAPRRAVLAFLASVVGLGAVAVGLWRASDRLWLGALGLILAGATVAYGLHRYELVRLGLVEDGYGDGGRDRDGDRDSDRDGDVEREGVEAGDGDTEGGDS